MAYNRQPREIYVRAKRSKSVHYYENAMVKFEIIKWFLDLGEKYQVIGFVNKIK